MLDEQIYFRRVRGTASICRRREGKCDIAASKYRQKRNFLCKQTEHLAMIILAANTVILILFTPLEKTIHISRGGGEQLESWDDGDLPPSIFGEDPYLRIFGQFPYPFLWNFGRQSLLNIPEIKFHFSLNAQYEVKVATNYVS